MIVLGLTGSIGMGKTETGRMFERLGVPVFDADRAVHELYGPGGAAVAPVEAAFPGVTVDGAVDRAALAARVLGDDGAVRRLEAIVHPLVQEMRARFLDTARAEGRDVVVVDIPLLFETGGEARVDKTVVVSAPAGLQRERVLARPGMTADRFEAILARQMPDEEKRRRADFVVDSSVGLDHAFAEVERIVASLRSGG
jgi:dephospho-CoA kinase